VTALPDEPDTPEPSLLKLACYPNPFNPSTAVSFDLARYGRASINIYNIKGQLVRRLLDKPLRKGSNQLVWDDRNDKGDNCTSGVYFIHLTSGGNSAVVKAVLMR